MDRVLQLQNMYKDSSDWLEARKRVEPLIKKANEKLESGKKMSHSVDDLKGQNADVKVMYDLEAEINWFGALVFLENLLMNACDLINTNKRYIILLQQLSKDIQQWQAQVNVANELANKLLTLYADDDTSKVKQMTESMNLAWANINKRWASVWICNFSVSTTSVFLWLDDNALLTQ